LKLIKPRTANQEAYVDSLKNNIATIALGIAGTGKTLLAIYTYLQLLEDPKSRITKMIYFRPAVPEKQIEDTGYLPGHLDNKVYSMCGGLFHNLEFIVGQKEAKILIESGRIAIELLSHIRGSSYTNCCLILDECAILHKESGAIKLFLSRIGKNCRVAIMGDINQTRLLHDKVDILDAVSRLTNMKDVGIINLNDFMDVQRSEFVREVLKRYDKSLENQKIKSESK